jgi:hypothetical protein
MNLLSTRGDLPFFFRGRDLALRIACERERGTYRSAIADAFGRSAERLPFDGSRRTRRTLACVNFEQKSNAGIASADRKDASFARELCDTLHATLSLLRFPPRASASVHYVPRRC